MSPFVRGTGANTKQAVHSINAPDNCANWHANGSSGRTFSRDAHFQGTHIRHHEVRGDSRLTWIRSKLNIFYMYGQKAVFLKSTSNAIVTEEEIKSPG